jgi:hypothetical protein
LVVELDFSASLIGLIAQAAFLSATPAGRTPGLN